jgi:glycosyltransferase involved in cell wall biosynthesis
MKTVAVIPAYNEERTIAGVVAEVKNYVDEAIVVDDGSSDGTAEQAKKAGALVYSHFINRGQGAALETGKKIALSRGADVIVTYDADGQFVAEEIKSMIKPVAEGKADVVLGSRFAKSDIPPVKRFFLKGATIFTRLTSGLSLSDTHNGFRAFSREAAEKIKIEQNRMAHASEILEKIGKYNLRYEEVPVTVKYFSAQVRRGQSLPDYFKILFDLFLGKTLND